MLSEAPWNKPVDCVLLGVSDGLRGIQKEKDVLCAIMTITVAVDLGSL